jgi:hypothetical protein
MVNFLIKYKPKWVDTNRPFTTEVAAVDEEAARAYFKHFFPSGEIVSIEKDE